MSSSSSEKPRKSRVKIGKVSVLCSTPLREGYKVTSPSDSTIHTNSSTPSIVIRRRLRQLVKAEKKQKPAKAEKERNPAKAKKERKPAKAEKKRKPAKAEKEQKEKKRKARTNRNKTKAKKPTDLDEWLTMQEQSDDEKENLKQSARSSTKKLTLFQDTASSEGVREAQLFHDTLLDSPIRQRRQDDENLVPVDLGYEKPLPVENILHLRTRFDSSDEEEDEKLYFKRNSPVKKYPGAREKCGRKRKREISIDKSKQWLVDLKVPTVAADMLWDQYVREHPEEMREYIAPPAKRQMKQNKQGKATEKVNIENWWSKKLRFLPNDVQDKVITCGHIDRTTMKWSRIVTYPDPYSFPGHKDPQFDGRKAGAPRIRLNEYLEECRAKKALDSQAAGPSCSRNEQITVNLDDSSSDSEPELRTILQRFKDRQNEREMLSKSVVESSNEKSLVPAKRIKQERASKSSKHDSERAKIADKSNGPVIRSVKKLVNRRYIKEKGYWRIV